MKILNILICLFLSGCALDGVSKFTENPIIPTPLEITQVKEMDAISLFSQVRFSSALWDSSLQADPLVNSLLDLKNFPIRYDFNDKLIIQCDALSDSSTECSNMSWDLDIDYQSVKQFTYDISPLTITKEELKNTKGKQTVFSFSKVIEPCSKVTISLTSKLYTVHIKDISMITPYDANGDGAVSQADFNQFRMVFNLPIDSRMYGDPNGDRWSAQADFNAFHINYGCILP